MKTRLLPVLAGILILVLCISVITTSVQAAEVWSADFDDELMTGWTTFSMESLQSGPIIAGNFSAEGGVLTSLDDDVNYAQHDSTVNVGTWTFDLYVPDTPNGYVGVAFMSNGTRPLDFDTRMIAIEVTTDGTDRFILWWIRGADNWLGDSFTIEGSVLGWHHIVVTRTNSGSFNIYVNGTMEYTTITNDVTGSTYLECYSINATGAMFDNIVVDDEVWPGPTTTEPTTGAPPPEIPYLLIAVGVGVAVVIILAVVCLRRR